MKIVLEHSSDFTDGVKISDKELNAWKKEILEGFKKEKSIDGPAFHTRRSGNAAVIAIKSVDSELEIFVIPNGYKYHLYTLLPNKEQNPERK